MKVKIVFEELYFPHKQKRLRENTLYGYQSSYNCHIKPAFGDRHIENITSIELQDWIDDIPTPGGAEKAFKTFRQMFRYYKNYYNNKIDDITKGIELPPKEAVKQEVFTKRQLKKIIKGIKNTSFEAVALVQLGAGLRKSEAFGAQWADIDLKTGKIFIHRSRQYINGNIYNYSTKNKMSTREVYLNKKILKRLRKLKKQYSYNNEYLCKDNPDEVAKRLKEYCLSNALPWIPMKNFRHTWATRALEEGAAIEDVAKWMGHTDIRMVYERYSQYSLKMQKRVLKKIKHLF